MNTTARNAFTFFELLSVVAIIFLVWGIVSGVKLKVADRKHEVIAVQDMLQISEQLEQFHLENNYYPDSTNGRHVPDVIIEKLVLAQPANKYEYALKDDHYGLRTQHIYWENSKDLFID